MNDDPTIAWHNGFNTGFDAGKEPPTSEVELYKQLRVIEDKLASLRIERMKHLGRLEKGQ